MDCGDIVDCGDRLWIMGIVGTLDCGDGGDTVDYGDSEL